MRSPSLSSSQGKFPILWVVMIGVGAITLGAATALLWQPITDVINQPSVLSTNDDSVESSQDDLDSIEVETIDDASNGALLGHKPYEEADEELLVSVVGDRSIRLRAAAAEHFADMVAAARADGIRLQPLSGFRTEEEQSFLFFEIRESRKQDLAERAAVSAPPGYSEHHTGYAIDIGDATQPGTHVSESFETTAAFKWLQDNASAYSFELSFEGGTDAAVSYEPWHWRFVGDRHSLETFYGDGLSDTSNPQTANPSSEQPSSEQPSSEQPSSELQ